MGVEFIHDSAGRLIAIHHTVEVDDAAYPQDAMRESDVLLRTLFAELAFLRGASLPGRTHSARRMAPPGAKGGIDVHGRAQLSLAGSVSVRIKMPCESAAASQDPRLRVWLERANGARDDDDPAHSLRDYYAILEEMQYPRPDELKFARDFVSHGGPLANPKLLKYVQDALGDATVDRYDPGNDKHWTFVLERRREAGSLVGQALRARLR